MLAQFPDFWMAPVSPTPSPSPAATAPPDSSWVQFWVPTIAGGTEIIAALIGVATVLLLFYTLRKTIEIAQANTAMAKANVEAAAAMRDSVELTKEIAEANSKSARATQLAAEAALKSAQVSVEALDEMREARQLQTAPYVIVYFEIYGGTIVNFVMENLGQSVAENVSLTFNPPLQAEHLISNELPAFFKEMTPNLAPRQKMNCWLFNTLVVLNKPEIPKKYEVAVSYRGGIQDRKYTHTFKLDVEIFLGTTIFDEPFMKMLKDGFKQVADTQKETSKAIGEMSDALDYKLTPLAAQSYLRDGEMKGNPSEQFKALVRGLESDWRIWQERKDPGSLLPSWMIGQRFYLSAYAIVSITPYLPISEDQLDRIRSLMFDLLASRRLLRYRSEEGYKQITEQIQELCTMADTVDAQPT